MGEARAVRLMVEALLATDQVPEARRLVEGHRASQGLSPAAAALMGLAVAEVHLAFGRPGEALKVAEESVEAFTNLGDDDGLAKALDTVGRIGIKLAETSSAGVTKALQAGEKLLALQRRRRDSKQEVRALLAICRAHLVRHDYEDAFAFACAAVELARLLDCSESEAAALRELASVVIALVDVGREDADTAVHYGKDAVEIYRSLGDKLEEITARLVLAKAFEKDGMASLALEEVQCALTLAHETGHRAHILALLDYLMKLHSTEKASSYMDKEAERSKKAGDVYMQAEALRRGVTLKLAHGKAEEAVTLAESILELFRKGGEAAVDESSSGEAVAARTRRLQGEARALESLAEAREAAKKGKEAIKTASEASEIFQQAGDIRGAARALVAVATFCDRNGRDREAVTACMDQRKIFKAAGWQDEEAQCLLLAAERLAKTSSAREGVRVAREAVALGQEAKDTAIEANAWLVTSDIQLNFAFDYRDAAISATHARRLYKTLGDALGEAKALKAAADVVLAQGMPEEQAISWTREALEVCLAAGDAKGEAYALQAIAGVYQALVREDSDSGLTPRGDILEEALNFTLLASAAHAELRDTRSQAMALLQLSHLYVQDDDGDAALQAAKESKALAEKFDEITSEAAALLAIADAQIFRQAWEEARDAAEDARELFKDMQDSDGEHDAQELINKACVKLERKLADKNKKKAPGSGPNGKVKPPKKRKEHGMWSKAIESIQKVKNAAREAAEKRQAELLRQPPPSLEVQEDAAAAAAPPAPALVKAATLVEAAAAEPRPAAAEGCGGPPPELDVGDRTPPGASVPPPTAGDQAAWIVELLTEARLQAHIPAAIDWVSQTGCTETDLREDFVSFTELSARLDLRRLEVKRLQNVLRCVGSDCEQIGSERR